MKTSVKKELAKGLFMLGGMTQKELAERVEVTENTMSKWCAEWKPILAAQKSTKQEVLARMDKAISDIFKKAEDEKRPLDSADYDGIAKLTKARETIDNKVGLATIIEVFQEYNSYLMAINPELARTNNKFQDEFVNLKANGN